MTAIGIQGYLCQQTEEELIIRFQNRQQAGVLLGEALLSFKPVPDSTVVLGLVRGGAAIAEQVALKCKLGWDIIIVRKIPAPDHPEYAVGAVSEFGNYVTNQQAIDQIKLEDNWINQAVYTGYGQCMNLQTQLRSDADPPVIRDRDVVLVDDGLATGLTMQAAIAGVQSQGSRRVTVAVPVIAPQALAGLGRDGIECCYLTAPDGFKAVGQYYDDFSAVSAEYVVQLLAQRGKHL